MTAISVPVLAAQKYALNGEQRLTAVISKTHINRVQVENDRIAAVYGGDGNYAIEADEVGGQLFLKSHNAAAGEPLYLTIITEGDITQDLKLTPAATDAQTIILKQDLSTTEHKSKEELSLSQNSYEQSLLDVIQQLAQERAVSDEGAQKDHAIEETQTESRLSSALTIRELHRISLKNLEGRTYEVVNTGSSPIHIAPELLNRSPIFQAPILALAIQEDHLEPQSHTKLFIVMKQETEGLK